MRATENNLGARELELAGGAVRPGQHEAGIPAMWMAYLGIEASSLDHWQRFAAEILGMEVDRYASEMLWLRMDNRPYRLFVTPGASDDVTVIGWEVADGMSLATMVGRLESRGIHVTRASDEVRRTRQVLDLVVFEDPDGLRHELSYGPLMLSERPFHSPRAISGFKVDDGGLGHIVLCVDDMAKAAAFYQDALGFRTSDIIDVMVGDTVMPVTFMRVNLRHHSLAIAQFPGKKRLHHIMMETFSLDDVGTTLDLVHDHGIEITMTLGRHTNDLMVSFYMRTPSGFEIEYGYGGLEVDNSDWRVVRYTAQSIWGHRVPKKQAASAA